MRRGLAAPIIFKSLEAATRALPKCPKPKGGQYDHWWYTDSEEFEKAEKNPDLFQDYIPCICGTCGQKMLLSVDAEEYPAI